MAHPHFGAKLTAATPILTIGVGLLAFAMGVPQWWLVFVIGWVVLTPLTAILVGDWGMERTTEGNEVGQAIERRIAQEIHPDEGATTSKEDALEVLRERYASGDIGEETFERMVERLLETESLEDAESFFNSGFEDASATLERDAKAETDTERDAA